MSTYRNTAIQVTTDKAPPGEFEAPPKQVHEGNVTVIEKFLK